MQNNEPIWFNLNENTKEIKIKQPIKIFVAIPCHSEISIHTCQSLLVLQHLAISIQLLFHVSLEGPKFLVFFLLHGLQFLLWVHPVPRNLRRSRRPSGSSPGMPSPMPTGAGRASAQVRAPGAFIVSLNGYP